MSEQSPTVETGVERFYLPSDLQRLIEDDQSRRNGVRTIFSDQAWWVGTGNPEAVVQKRETLKLLMFLAGSVAHDKGQLVSVKHFEDSTGEVMGFGFVSTTVLGRSEFTAAWRETVSGVNKMLEGLQSPYRL